MLYKLLNMKLYYLCKSYNLSLSVKILGLEKRFIKEKVLKPLNDCHDTRLFARSSATLTRGPSGGQKNCNNKLQ